MYVREIQAPIDSPVQDGNPVIGTWTRPFKKVDLLKIDKPYSLSFLPKWVINLRIKEWQCYSVQNEEFLMEAVFCDFKLFKLIQVLFYDIKSDEKYIYRDFTQSVIKFGTEWKFPDNLANEVIEKKSSKIYFRIHNWLDAGIVRLNMDISSGHRRLPFKMNLAFNVNYCEVTPMTVSLANHDSSGRRIQYGYKVFAGVRGDIVLGEKQINLKEESCPGIFSDYKGFLPYMIQTAVCSATGVSEDNKRFGFQITENKTRESNKNNGNALWFGGELTPLPPVLITMPYGQDDVWVIQDFEGMIDLTYTPILPSAGKKTDFKLPIGYYNGILVTKNGEQIPIKNLLGIGEKSILRV